MNIWEHFLVSGIPSLKMPHYFPIYEKHFSQWKNKTVTVLELGVWNGFSTDLWSKYFGPMATIVGIDINSNCKHYERLNTKIRIGDQSDTNFLQQLIDEFGPPDIVIDDGSHIQNHVTASFEFLFPKLSKNGIYFIEDLHTSYWEDYGGGLNEPTSFINKCKGYLDQMNSIHIREDFKTDPILSNLFSLTFYDSIAVFEKGTPFMRDNLMCGVRNPQQ